MGKAGYSGAILKVDLSTGKTNTIPSDEYVDRFIGGRGLAAKLYWDNVPPNTQAFAPENMMIFSTGPLAGFPRLAGSRWQVCGKSPATDPQWFSYCNIGGSWGAWMKFAGYDAITVQGKSDKPVYLFIHDGKTEIKDASALKGKNGAEARQIIQDELGKDVRVLSTGVAGENLVSFAGILSNEDSHGDSGFGAVMGSKNLKAIAVIGDKRPAAADPARLSKVSDYIFQLRKAQGSRKHKWIHEGKTKQKACYGCIAGCIRQYYETADGRQVKFFCHFGDMYENSAVKYYGKWNEVVVDAADLCHHYTLDSFVMEPMILWLGKCYEAGILTEKETGLPLSKIGSPEFLQKLVDIISLRQGFGDVLARGTFKAAEIVGKNSADLIGDTIITRSNDFAMYDPRLYLVTGILYATEPRKPIQQLHEVTTIMHQWVNQQEGQPVMISNEAIAKIAELFWGGRLSADFSTYEGKALMAKKIQDRTYAKESLILCDFNWPIMWIRPEKDHIGDPTIESQVYSAITGDEKDEDGLNQLGERVFNLQRAIRLRDGWGKIQKDRLFDIFYNTPMQTARFNEHCIVPDKNGNPVSRKGKVVETDKFEKMMSEYYQLRGWDAKSGLPTEARFKELEISDIYADLKKRKLVK
ncbi:MAG: aldehyde ferredoxin oxidoreductase N-terminal domain-containing protein [Chloroflexota bacterium]